MKLVDYICEELDELENKAEKNGKLTMAEIQYMDTLAHAKKNLLKGDMMMEEEGHSMARGRNARRGRYSRRMHDGGMSYANDLADSIYDIMDELPDDVRRDAQKLVKKIESM